MKENNKNYINKVIDDSPYNKLEKDDDKLVKETYIATESIAYYPSLYIPGQDEVRSDLDPKKYIIGLNKNTKGFTNNILISKNYPKTSLSEFYNITYSENKKKSQICSINKKEFDQIVKENDIEFYILNSNKEINIRDNDIQIQEAINNIPLVEATFMTESINIELTVIRGLLTVLKENDINLFEDDFNEYFVSKSWLLNSPLLERILIEDINLINPTIDPTNKTYKQKLINVINDNFNEYVINSVKNYNTKEEIFNIVFNYYNESVVSSLGKNDIDNDLKFDINNINNVFEFTHIGAKISPLSEFLQLLSLFIYMKNINDLGKEGSIKLICSYPTEKINEKLSINEHIKKYSKIYIYIEDKINDKYTLYDYESEEVENENSLKVNERIFHSHDYTTKKEMKEKYEGRTIITINDIDEEIAKNIFDTDFNNISPLIEYLFTNPNNDQDIYVTNNVFDEEFIDEEKAKELNEAASDIKDIRKSIMDKISKVYKNLDKSGENLNRIKSYWDSMSDDKFIREMKRFANDDEKNFTLEVLPNKNEPTLEDIKKALKSINVPENEYVYFRHLEGAEDNPIRTRYPVPVGYLHVRRLQQMIETKNSYSLDISSRNVKTDQVTGDSKVSRISDLEASALKAINADKSLKELLSARADDRGAKNQLYADIGTFGYSKLADLPDNIEDKRTLNTISTYLIASGIDNTLTNDDKLIKELEGLVD